MSPLRQSWAYCFVQQSGKSLVGFTLKCSARYHRDIAFAMIQNIEFVVTDPGVVNRPFQLRINLVGLKMNRIFAESKAVF
jgi:hypothetical protein